MWYVESAYDFCFNRLINIAEGRDQQFRAVEGYQQRKLNQHEIQSAKHIHEHVCNKEDVREMH